VCEDRRGAGRLPGTGRSPAIRPSSWNGTSKLRLQRLRQHLQGRSPPRTSQEDELPPEFEEALVGLPEAADHSPASPGAAVAPPLGFYATRMPTWRVTSPTSQQGSPRARNPSRTGRRRGGRGEEEPADGLRLEEQPAAGRAQGRSRAGRRVSPSTTDVSLHAAAPVPLVGQRLGALQERQARGVDRDPAPRPAHLATWPRKPKAVTSVAPQDADCEQTSAATRFNRSILRRPRRGRRRRAGFAPSRSRRARAWRGTARSPAARPP